VGVIPIHFPKVSVKVVDLIKKLAQFSESKRNNINEILLASIS